MKEVRRTAKDALFHQSEVARLEKLLTEAGVDSRKRGTITSPRMEVLRLRQDLRSPEAARDTAAVRASKAAPTPKPDKGTVATLRREVDSLTRKNARLHKALERARERNDELATLRKANDLQGKKIEALRARNAGLEARIARLQSTRSALSQALFGSKSQKQKREGTGRKRGQQRGAPGHGRTPRPGLGEKKERRNPPKAARTCSCCGKPYVANGERSTSLIEIEVKAHIRRILRTRWRRGCECASSPLQVIAPPPARLFDNTPYGVGVWTRFLFEHCACQRPLSRIAAWMGDQGMPIWPGTLADSIKRFVPLFDPLAEAILANQNEAALRHADETGWRVQEFRRNGRSSRAWLWISVSEDALYYLIDRSRSAEVRVISPPGRWNELTAPQGPTVAQALNRPDTKSRQAPVPGSPASEASVPTLRRREKASLRPPNAHCCTNRVGDVACEIARKTPAFRRNHVANGAPGNQRVTRTHRCDTVSQHWCLKVRKAGSVKVSTTYTPVSRTPW